MDKSHVRTGQNLRQKYGADNVFDFSLGNPDLEPPVLVREVLKRLCFRIYQKCMVT